MHITALILSLALTSAASALAIRQSNPCTGLDASAFSSSTGFTLAAYNLTQPNANATGAPLLARVAGAIAGASTDVITTWASWQDNTPNAWTLTDGALTPAGQAGSDADVDAGGVPSFIFEADPPPGAQIYCGVTPDGDAMPSLAVHGDAGGWAICEAANAPTWDLVYKPSQSSTNYKAESCYGVRVHMISSD